MRKPALAALLAVAGLVSLATTAPIASANRSLRFGGERSFTGTTASFALRSSELDLVACETTFQHVLTVERFSKAVARRLPEGVVAKVTEARTSNCREAHRGPAILTFLASAGRGEFLERYDQFLGTLPSITGISLTMLGVAVHMQGFGFDCLFQGEVAVLYSMTETPSPALAGRLPVVIELGLCPRAIDIGARFTYSRLFTLTLI
jgi:hypothetical protein